MEFNKNFVYLKKIKYLNFLLRSVCIITRMPSHEKSVIPRKHYIVLLEWMYTAVFYVVSCFVFYDLMYTKSFLKPFVDNVTMDSINYVLITSLSISVVVLNPLLACRAHVNREKYFQLWREYQIQYEQYTFSKLNIGSSGFIFTIVFCGIIVTALELAANCILTSQTTPTYMYAYWLIYFYTNFTTVMWITDCHLLANASEKLIQRLLTTAATSSNKMTGMALEPRVFGRYVELWRKLSHMTERLIETGQGQYDFNFFIQSVIVVQAFYGIAGLYIGQRQSIHYNIYFPTAVWSILNLIVLCEAAYSVTTQVGFKTKVAVQSMACSMFSLETQEQIFTALKTIQSDSPEITVGGYFTMDRAYITTYLGVAISYIIVLVQFKIGTL